MIQLQGINCVAHPITEAMSVVPRGMRVKPSVNLSAFRNGRRNAVSSNPIFSTHLGKSRFHKQAASKKRCKQVRAQNADELEEEEAERRFEDMQQKLKGGKNSAGKKGPKGKVAKKIAAAEERNRQRRIAAGVEEPGMWEDRTSDPKKTEAQLAAAKKLKDEKWEQMSGPEKAWEVWAGEKGGLYWINELTKYVVGGCPELWLLMAQE
ncbi:hypothetical protein CYMTET_37164 [Cymbomonas tetramitiformis]|uniref:Uncharacterized protein n=1 Tax=Cymbomonas tetramitiformis TaxID=36881 RepID=A0AAE0CG18_9CHLO|nr:hypothetical protein CYMTET_37164 [Cymbomonas tetramitiformis]